MHAVPLRHVAHLFVAASRAVNDCGLSIKLAEESGVGNTGLLGHMAMAAATVREFIKCLAEYAPILVTGIDVSFTEQDGTGRFVCRAPADIDAPIKPLSLFIAASLVFGVRVATGPNWVPLSVSFCHKAPAATKEELGVFGSRLVFDTDAMCMTFDAATLAKPMPSANRELFSIFKHHAWLLITHAQKTWTTWRPLFARQSPSA